MKGFRKSNSFLLSLILFWGLGFFLWWRPVEIPLEIIYRTLALLSMQALLHVLLQKFFPERMRFLHFALAFPISVLIGTVNVPFASFSYLLVGIWLGSSYQLPKLFLWVLLSFLPEAVLWGLLQKGIQGIPFPLGADPILFDWSAFQQQLILIVSLPFLVSLALSFNQPRRTVVAPVASAFMSKPKLGDANEEKSSTGPIPSIQTPPATGRRSIVSDEEPSLSSVMSMGSGPSDLGGILESIVFFMSKNFKSYSALGLLSFDDGRTFVINASISKSSFFRNDVLVYPGSGIVGDAIREPKGFMSGNIKGYPSKLEYYSRADEVGSIIISRVLDDDTHKVMGLLVVDNNSLNGFRSEDKDLLNRFSVVASKLISNARMRKVLETTAHQGETIYQISKLLAAENYTRGVLGVLIDNLRTVFDADRLIICDFVADKASGRVLKIAGEGGDLKEGLLFPIDDPLSLYGMVFVHKTEYLEAGVLRENRYRFHKTEEKEHAPAEVLVAPLLDESSNILAVIGLESNSPGRFETRSIVLLQTILANASSALTRANLFTKLERQATIDGLTKVPNHRHFQDTLDKYLAKHQQLKKPLGLLLMDIDHFKKFNDTYGHPVGDKVLQVVAATIARTIRVNDFVARYGGEEFVVVIDAEPGLILQMAERIRVAIETQSLDHEGKELKVTVSIGASFYPLDATTKKDLIEFADQAMYKSKESGRNRVTLWSQRTGG